MAGCCRYREAFIAKLLNEDPGLWVGQDRTDARPHEARGSGKGTQDDELLPQDGSDVLHRLEFNADAALTGFF
jgi:hypothetical protein